MYNAHKLNYTANNICYEHRPLNGVWIDGVNYDEEIKEKNARIATLEELHNQAIEIIKKKNAAILALKNNKGISEMQDEIARLTAGSEAMQEDARNNTATINLLMAQLAEVNEENRGLRQMLRMEAK